MTDDLARALAFDRRLLERLSTDVVPWSNGVAYLDLDFPLRYDSNLLWVDEPGALTAERLAAEADRILGGAGMRHRGVAVTDAEAAARLAVGFADLGWANDHDVLMVHEGDPQRPRDTSPAEEGSFAELRPLIEEITRRAPWATNGDTVRMLTDHHGKVEREAGARFFGARVDGRWVGCCELYLDGPEAQVESVETLEEHRGHGLASAFVLRAVEAAREAGATWVHLWADRGDWPQHWYRTLGFREAASVSDYFTRWPEAEAIPATDVGGAKSPVEGEASGTIAPRCP